MSDTNSTSPEFGYALLRETLLPELLGHDEPEILYWAGKSLARKYPCDSIEEIMEFFNKAYWGELQLIHEKKRELQLKLQPTNDTYSFLLEAGFLAEQLSELKNAAAETYMDEKKEDHIFYIRWDKE